MKKSKKVRIMGQDMRYFVDGGAINEDGEEYCKVILYGDKNERWYWNMPSVPRTLTGSDVKKAFMERKFKRNT